MSRIRKKQKPNQARKTGLPPGSVIFTGSQKVDKVFIHHMRYSVDGALDQAYDNHDQIAIEGAGDDKINWFDVRGLHDTTLIETLGRDLNIHPLILEDVVDIHQRPKLEEYDEGIFIIVRALSFDREQIKVDSEQVAIFFRHQFLISFQERETDLFAPVRERILHGKGRIRLRGTDYLAYALVDALVDNYYVILDDLETIMEELEDRILEQPDHSIKERIHHLKKEFMLVRRSMGPLREAISHFVKLEIPGFDERVRPFVRDLYDHTVQLTDRVDIYRDLLNGLQDLYNSEISYRMNQVMQTLTMITAIFVPLSFLAGVYGMNFDNMPELHYPYGYYILLSGMFLIFVGSVVYFKRKKWF